MPPRGPTKEMRAEMKARRQELTEAMAQEEKKHVRGRWVTDSDALQNIAVRHSEAHQRAVPRRVARAAVLQVEENPRAGIETEQGEVTDRVTQKDVLEAVDFQTQKKKFDLKLDRLGPYGIDFSLNGTHVALAGLRGHLANVRWQQFSLEGEVQLKDRITDVKFLIDHSMIACAQKKYVYMYSKEGVEMHILSKMTNMTRLAYLPKHMLLCAASSTYSHMVYLDVSTGKEVGIKPPSIMHDPTICMATNPSNGVVTTCDVRGVAKFWSPTVPDALVQIKAHKGGAQDIAFHRNGRYFVTLGGDHKMKIWDTRTLRALEEYAVTYAFNTIDISDRGLLAMGGGTNIQIWTNMFTSARQSSPHMKHYLGYGNIAHQVRFCPFEDVLGIGHSNGFSSIIVPGSAEANIDYYYANPYETERHRKERVVTNLLDKLQPETISMDLKVDDVNEKALAEYAKNLQANRKAKNIRERKARRTATTQGDNAPTGLLVGDDEEVDEELGFKEKGVAKTLKSKKEKQKEKKMAKWDKKDTTDKIRSKQVMRTSRIIQKQRHQRELKAKEAAAASATSAPTAAGEKRGGGAKAPTHVRFTDDGDDAGLSTKRARRDDSSGTGVPAQVAAAAKTNAAFRRFA